MMKIDGTYHTYQLRACGTCQAVDPEGVEACSGKCLYILVFRLILVVVYRHKSFSSSSITFPSTFLIRSGTHQPFRVQELIDDIVSTSGIIVQVDTMSSIGLNNS